MKSLFKILTFIFLMMLFIGQAFPVVDQQDQKSHLRWKIKSQKQQVNISKSVNKVTIQTLDPDFFLKFSESIAKLPRNKNYHSNYKFTKPERVGAPYKLEIDLKDNSVELFSFYKQDSSEYIMDFWINQDIVQTKKASINARDAGKVKLAKRNVPKKKVAKKITSKPKVSKVITPKKNAKFQVIDPAQIESQQNKGFRDFRYGAAFIWDYPALIPPLKQDLDLSKKAPDFLYEVQDMKMLDDKKQAHMQLSINFYRKQEWGLMIRSINLYQQRYGKTDQFRALNDFMKAVSLVRNTINKKVDPKFISKLDEAGELLPAPEYSDKGIQAAARNLMISIVDTSEDYRMKMAVLRYLIQDARDREDYVKALDFAKKLYVESSESYDDDNVVLSSRVILNCLANLKQLDKIEKFLGNKVVKRLLPAQEGLAYIDFVNLSLGQTDQVFKNYKRERESLTKPIHPSLLFNIAESYFRVADYQQAIKHFDEFITNYSYYSYAGKARLRLAMAFDLLDKDPQIVLQLYKDAINKSSDVEARYEAKVRYVGMRVARNTNLKKDDAETVVFLETDPSEQKFVVGNIQKLLWLTRLRSFIAQEKYNDALAYLSTVPVETLRAIDQRVFVGDAAEIVLGLIKKSYMKEDYARAVKIWETYKEKFQRQVTKNPYTNFIVADSFLKLSLYKSFDKSMSHLKALNKTNVRNFPLWVRAHKSIPIEDYIVELNLNRYLKQNDFKGLRGYLSEVKNRKNVNYKFYNGLVSYHMKNYTYAVSDFEDLLIRPNLNNILSPYQNQLMVEAYLESLYEAEQPAKFRKNAMAVIQDLRNNDKENLRPLLVRAEYLYLESLFAERNVDYRRLSKMSDDFLRANKNTPYNYRINYLKGVGMINSSNVEEGKKILKEIIEGNDVPAYLKGLAKTELSTFKLKNNTL